MYMLGYGIYVYYYDMKLQMLDLYLTNNTDQPIVVNSLEFKVSESEIDSLPYVYVCEDTPYGESVIRLVNGSWFDWGTMHLDYSIMKRGEEFNGTYKKRKSIPYFEDEYLVDFTQDLVDMGLNMENLYHYDSEGEKQLIDASEISENRDEILAKVYPFEVSDYEGFARIYGKISFSKCNFTKHFFGHIYFTSATTDGGGMDLSDKFDVKLSYDKRDYSISYPYHTTLRPGDNERVRLTINCPRSSNHRFYISINNDNGLVMRTKAVQMHYLNARNSMLKP